MLLRISNRTRSQCKSSVFISNNFTLFRTIDFDKHSIAIPNAIGEIQFQSGEKIFVETKSIEFRQNDVFSDTHTNIHEYRTQAGKLI